MNKEDLQLSIEDIDKFEYCRNMSMEQKLAFISFIYEISVALYNSYRPGNEARQNAKRLEEKEK